MEEKSGKSLIDKLVDVAFSKNNIKWIILIIILAAILRFLLANNIGFLGDEMVHGPHAIGILKTNVLSRMTQSIVWFYLTDLAYKIFGVTGFSARFLSFFFGVLCIPLVYLLGKEFYNERLGLVAAFLLAISAFTIRYTLIEMDIAAVFFVLLAMLFFIKEAKKGRFSYLSMFFLGIGALMKLSAFFFVPGFIIWFYLIQEKPKETFKKSKKNFILFLIIALLMFAPIFAHNYFLYKDKGIVDVYFSKFFNINREVYAYHAGIDLTFNLKDLFLGGPKMLWSLTKLDPLLIVLGIIGMFLMFIKKEFKQKSILFLSVIIPFLLLSISVLLQTHFTIIMPFMAIFAASTIQKMTNNFNNKKTLYSILIIILLLNLYLILPHLTSQAATIKTRNYAENIPNNALVLVDGRFYTGRMAWMFYDKNYLSTSYLGQIFSTLANFSSSEIPIETYFVECSLDDCGWGTIADQPDFNQSMEDIATMLKQDATLQKTFYSGGGYDEPSGVEAIKIYKKTILVKPEIISLARQTHYWFQYSLNYEEESYDDYNVYGVFDNSIDLFAHIILYLSIFFAIISPIFIIWLWKKYN